MLAFSEMRGGFAIFTALLAFLPVFVQAQAPAASTFYLDQTETQFSLNLANDSTDVFLYFTSPAYSWVGVGFGAGMKDSLMFVLYPNEKGDNVVISPRIADGHSEPSFAPDVQVDVLDGSEIKDEMFVVKAVCRNCRVWRNGFLDAKNTAHPMIYAFGPGHKLQSNQLDAPLHRHIRYGKFNMNMVAATGKGEVPAASSALSGVEMQGQIVKDHDRANLAHAVMGCIAIFVFWPLNVIVAGFLKNIKIHVGVSIFIMIFLIISYALGIVTSSEYNRSKSFNSPHQILAFLSLLPILLISLLPLRPLARLSPLIPRLHTPLTSLTFVFLVLTGGLGLHLYSAPMPIITAYIAIALGVFVFNILLQACIKRRGSAYARANTRARLGEEDEQDLVLARYYANRKLENENGGASASSLGSAHARSVSEGSQTPRGNVYGGGAMPGPQYLLNMHPGVPVHRW